MLCSRASFLSSILLLACSATAGAGPIVPVTDTAPDGRSYPELAAAWYQWGLAAPASISPLTDRDGRFAGVGQAGPVWFLAPGIGTDTSYTRTATIPADKCLFFPVLTAIAFNLPDETSTEAELRSQLADFCGQTSILYATVDGTQVLDLWNYRAASPPGGFSVLLPKPNIYDLPAGNYDGAVDDGWWLLLQPLSIGQHKIVFTSGTGDPSALGLADYYQSTTYNITVVPEPAAAALLVPAGVLILRRRHSR